MGDSRAIGSSFPDSPVSRTFLLSLFHAHFFLVLDLDMAMPFKDALARLENSRVKSTRPLIPPQILQEDLPL